MSSYDIQKERLEKQTILTAPTQEFMNNSPFTTNPDTRQPLKGHSGTDTLGRAPNLNEYSEINFRTVSNSEKTPSDPNSTSR